MASTKNTISFSIALLATAILLSTTAARKHSTVAQKHKAASGVIPLCNDADDKALCTQMIHGGNTWAMAMTNALNDALEKVKAAKPMVDSIATKLPGNLLPVSKNSIQETCQEIYSNIVDNIESSIGFVKKDPDSSLKFTLSAISFTTCCDTLEEFNVSQPEATAFHDEMLKIVGTLLALADAKP